MTKLKNSNCDKTLNLKFGEKKPKNSNSDQTQQLKFGQQSLTQIVTCCCCPNCNKLKDSNSIKTQKLKLQHYKTNFHFFLKSCGRNNFTPQQPMRCTQGSLLQSRYVFFRDSFDCHFNRLYKLH